MADTFPTTSTPVVTKRLRVSIENFLTVPWESEQLIFLGCLICLDAFLYVFTILPARIIIALLSLFKSVFWSSARLYTAQNAIL
ncbi:hypothetical protein BC830DRAFT_1153028 [Chytriomyces sp. MP71]|nr:hypothetical protein BC830DRAFT_1153028 [Chytriomyces sp. MP71]